MMKIFKNLSCLALLAVFAAPNGVVFGDLLTGNGGFENGTGADADLWRQFGPGISARDDSMPDTGSFALRLFADESNLSASAIQDSIFDVGLPSLQQNTVVTADFRYKTNFGPGGVGFAALRILNGDGAIVADSGLQMLGSNANYADFMTLALDVPTFAGGANDTYAAFIEFSVAAGAFSGSFSEAFIDNVNVQGTVVPEPTSACLLAAGLGLVAIRRRR